MPTTVAFSPPTQHPTLNTQPPTTSPPSAFTTSETSYGILLCDASAWENARFVSAIIGGWAVTHDRFGQQPNLGASLHRFLPPTTTQDLDNLPSLQFSVPATHGHCASAGARPGPSSPPSLYPIPYTLYPILPNYRSLAGWAPIEPPFRIIILCREVRATQ